MHEHLKNCSFSSSSDFSSYVTLDIYVSVFIVASTLCQEMMGMPVPIGALWETADAEGEEGLSNNDNRNSTR